MSAEQKQQPSPALAPAYNRISDITDAAGKVALLRVDLNVPTNDDGDVTDTTRIDRIKPTIEALRDKGMKIVLLSHFGRPKGQRKDEFSLSFLAPFMSDHFGMDIKFADDCIGDSAETAISSLQNGDVLLLENVRFHGGEEQNDTAFARALADLGDLYINDAFSAAHRAHASTEGLAHLLPAYAGLLMDAELSALRQGLETPQKPVAALVGGAKISTKLDLLNNLIEKVDYLVLGGGMANTFLAAKECDMKSSLCEHDMLDTARNIMAKARQIGCEIILPQDVVCAKEFKAHAPHTSFAACDIADDYMALDIGEESCAAIEEIISQCKTVVWNGPLGAFEIAPFDAATTRLAKFVAQRTSDNALVSVAGGGDTVSALKHAGAQDGFTYLSSAGGAFLEWLEGKDLPGVAALSR